MDDPSPLESVASSSDARNAEIAVYSGPKVGIGAYIGGPFAATYMLSRNFAALGERSRAKQTLLIGGAASVALFLLIVLVIPERIMEMVPNVVIPMLYTGAFIGAFRGWQAAPIETHLEAGGKAASGWRVAGVSVVGLIVTLGLVLGVALMAPTMDGERVTVGALEHEVFYEPPVTEAQALQVGEALNAMLFSQLDFATYVKIEQSDAGYSVFFPVQDDAWLDPAVVADYRGMLPALRDALSAADVTIVLFHEGLRGRENHPI